MLFWRKKKNQKAAEEEKLEEELLHPKGEEELENAIEEDSGDNLVDESTLEPARPETEVFKNADVVPTPVHSKLDDAREAEELSDHTNEGGWLSRLSKGLSKSTNKLSKNLGDILTKKKLDKNALDELEEALIMADLGPKTAAHIVEEFAKGRFEKDIDANEIREALAMQIENILRPVAAPLIPEKQDGEPFVILMTGVNGVGKTTTIGKMARQYQDRGLKVVMAAADTFRAAAVEQLGVWAERNHCKIVTKDIGADPAAVAFEAYDVAKAEGADILMIDTAGRLQNKKNLMEELQKVVRVLKKQNENAPHASLLVLDATTGQNALSQAETFKELVDISGLVVTKLDGSAKGGVLVSLADQFKIPVHAIGVGEGIEDLQPFTAHSYARSLMGCTEEKLKEDF